MGKERRVWLLHKARERGVETQLSRARRRKYKESGPREEYRILRGDRGMEERKREVGMCEEDEKKRKEEEEGKERRKRGREKKKKGVRSQAGSGGVKSTRKRYV